MQSVSFLEHFPRRRGEKTQFFGKRGMDPWTMKEALETQAERKAAKDYANTELREIT